MASAGCGSNGEVLLPRGAPDAALDASTPVGEAAADAATDERAQGGDRFAPPDAGDAACAFGPSGEALHLACAGLYSDWASKTVSSKLTPFVPALELWSDGAHKSRWIELPPGSQIDTSDMDAWTFPVGTRLFKEFRLNTRDAAAPIRIETRMLWKQAASTWYRTTYRWSADGESDAVEMTAGEQNVDGTSYEIPAQIMCPYCHQGRPDDVLGFEAVSLSVPGASPTLSSLAAEGLLSMPPNAPIAIPGTSVDQAALGWLHMNCGTTCHNAGGPAASTHFFMRLDVSTLASVSTTDAVKTGWGVKTSEYRIPGAATTYRFAPCDLAESAAYYRSSHRDGLSGTPMGTQMPPIDTHRIDPSARINLAAWINQGCGGGTPDAAP